MRRVLPILFNSEMVQAIMTGRKMVTRRVMKPQPWKIGEGIYECRHEKGFFDIGGNDWACRQCGCGVIPMKGGSYFHAPYQPGDILYVRETWSYEQDDECIGATGGECPHKSCEEADDPCFKCHYIYKASDNLPVGEKWHPSIHMPKKATRIWLKVTDVRVERLQDITDEQAEREGCIDYTSTANGFCYIWDSTLKKSDLDRYGWDANPWVWVIEFERCEKPESGV